MKYRKALLVFALVAMLALALTACGGEADLGTEENPIKWVLVPSSEAEGVLAGFGSFTDMVYEETGLVIEAFVSTSNAAAIEALQKAEEIADPVQKNWALWYRAQAHLYQKDAASSIPPLQSLSDQGLEYAEEAERLLAKIGRI